MKHTQLKYTISKLAKACFPFLQYKNLYKLEARKPKIDKYIINCKPVNLN